ncbi:MAG TPA: caspase family protein, partial [Thermoanaerobaculia bacterium]|nr:caspase family protein [Thermoanaerobaculia bacterium]
MRRLLLILLYASALRAERRALLIGINDYTASRLAAQKSAAPNRDWPNIAGAVNDARLFQDLLVQRYGFDRANILMLNDQAATRDAILNAIQQHLVAQAAEDDVIFFYYAGHGSQVLNTRSPERDRLDESIVPADSRRGA